MPLSKTGRYVMYLRKSRKDLDLASDTDVLARHEQILRETARRLDVVIADVYREVKSGDSISARPMMQRLLSELSEGMWDGVLVVEIERLARGDTIDQGLVARAFQDAGSLIITPAKVYDPNNEFDEEYFEFGLFMSRREYKTIKRRMQRGRTQASKEGKYCGNITPYGYARKPAPDGRGYFLVPDPNEADVIRNIFDWYVNGIPRNGGRVQAGTTLIADQLNADQIPPRKGTRWSYCSVYDILKNPVYIGKITWSKRHTMDSLNEDGSIRFRDGRSSADAGIYDGLHEALISDTLYFAAQRKRQSSRQSHVHHRADSSNALSGLIRCKDCGRNLFFRKAGSRSPKDTMICNSRNCSCIGCFYDVLERRVIDAIREYADTHVSSAPDTSLISAAELDFKRCQKVVADLSSQLERIFTAYERGIYPDEVFLARSSAVQKQIADAQDALDEANRRLGSARSNVSWMSTVLPRMAKIANDYWSVDSPAARNRLLKEVIDHIDYEKHEKSPKGGPFDNFTLTVYPKLSL